MQGLQVLLAAAPRFTKQMHQTAAAPSWSWKELKHLCVAQLPFSPSSWAELLELELHHRLKNQLHHQHHSWAWLLQAVMATGMGTVLHS